MKKAHYDNNMGVVSRWTLVIGQQLHYRGTPKLTVLYSHLKKPRKKCAWIFRSLYNTSQNLSKYAKWKTFSKHGIMDEKDTIKKHKDTQSDILRMTNYIWRDYSTFLYRVLHIIFIIFCVVEDRNYIIVVF